MTCYNVGRNISSKTWKIGNIKQDKKNLISTFVFFNCYCKNVISGREID